MGQQIVQFFVERRVVFGRFIGLFQDQAAAASGFRRQSGRHRRRNGRPRRDRCAKNWAAEFMRSALLGLGNARLDEFGNAWHRFSRQARFPRRKKHRPARRPLKSIGARDILWIEPAGQKPGPAKRLVLQHLPVKGRAMAAGTGRVRRGHSIEHKHVGASVHRRRRSPDRPARPIASALIAGMAKTRDDLGRRAAAFPCRATERNRGGCDWRLPRAASSIRPPPMPPVSTARACAPPAARLFERQVTRAFGEETPARQIPRPREPRRRRQWWN